MIELRVIWIIVEGYDGDAVFKLEGERVHRVVYEDDVSERAVLDDSKVLDVRLSDDSAALAVEPELEVASVWINVVEDGVGVGLVRGSEDSNLEVLVGFLQAFIEVGSQIEAGLTR